MGGGGGGGGGGAEENRNNFLKIMLYSKFHPSESENY